MMNKGLTGRILFLIVIIASVTYSVAASGYKIKIYTDSLANGLKVYYITDNSTPVVSALMYYRIGSFDETADKNGMAHVMEHLMFGETENIPAGMITSYIEEAGGTYGASTSYEESVYYTKLPSNQLKLALWIESQRLGKLRITEKELEKQKKIVFEELKSRDLNQPYSEYYSLIPKIIYDAWPIIGNEQHIKGITVKEVTAFYNEHYIANNAALVISGDFDLAEARNLAREYFGGYKSRQLQSQRKFTLPIIAENYIKEIEDPKVQNPAFFINFRGPGIKDSSYYFMNLLSVILTNGENSRLRKNLVSVDITGADVSMTTEYLENMGLITIKAVLPEGSDIKKAEEKIREAITTVVTSGISEGELADAKNYIESKLVFEKLDRIKLSEKIARFGILFNNHELINNEFEKYKSVTPEQIRNAAKKYLATKRSATLFFEN